MGKINKKLQIKSPKTVSPNLIKINKNPADDGSFKIPTEANIVPKNKNKVTPGIKKTNFMKKNRKNIPKIKDNSKILFEKAAAPKKLKTKKEKLKLKHSALLNKIDLIKGQELENAKRKKREQTRITGDLNPLKDALPSLDELLKLKPNEIKTGMEKFEKGKSAIISKKLRKKEKLKGKKQEFMDRYKCFNAILKDKKFKQNPREAIAQHIKFIATNQN